MWLRYGSDVVRMWFGFGCGLDVVQMSLGRVFGCGRMTREKVETSNINNSVRQLGFGRYFKITCVKNHVWFRFLNYICLLRWAILLTVGIDGANIQLHYVKICVYMWFWNLLTITLSPKITSRVVFVYVM